jgi:hypothetical protein
MTRHSLLVTVLFVLLICGAPTAKAGFAIRKQTALTEITASAEAPIHVLSRKEMRQAQLKSVKKYVLHEDHQPRTRKCSANGWEGTAAMWCGIGSVWMPPALILAIIFGALGLGEGHKHRGRATVGLIIGITGIFLIGMIATLAAAF